MYEPVYITIGNDGHVTLFWGDGTEDFKDIIVRGPRPHNAQEMAAIVEDLKTWAEEQGYTVVVPERDLSYTDIDLDITETDARDLSPDDIDDFLDDLFNAGE